MEVYEKLATLLGEFVIDFLEGHPEAHVKEININPEKIKIEYYEDTNNGYEIKVYEFTGE